jgi:hypothetical protein
MCNAECIDQLPCILVIHNNIAENVDRIPSCTATGGLKWFPASVGSLAHGLRFSIDGEPTCPVHWSPVVSDQELEQIACQDITYRSLTDNLLV